MLLCLLREIWSTPVPHLFLVCFLATKQSIYSIQSRNHIARYPFFVGFQCLGQTVTQPSACSSLDEVLRRDWLLENVASPIHFVHIICHQPNAQSSTLDSGSGSSSGLDHDASSDDSSVMCECESSSHAINSSCRLFQDSYPFKPLHLSELMAHFTVSLGRSSLMAQQLWHTFRFRLFRVHGIVCGPFGV